jgi:hypothetical protein
MKNSAILKALVFSLAVFASGCGAEKARQEALQARAAEQAAMQRMAEETAARKAAAEAEAAKRPKFESELHVNHGVGGAGSSSHKSTRHTDGKPFTAVEDYSTTIKGDKATVKLRVTFLKHDNGADLFEVEWTIEKPGGSQSTKTNVPYKGEKKTILENEFVKAVLQPPGGQ